MIAQSRWPWLVCKLRQMCADDGMSKSTAKKSNNYNNKRTVASTPTANRRANNKFDLLQQWNEMQAMCRKK